MNLAQRYAAPGLDIIDVGANVGLFSVALAKTLSNGRLLAIELSAAMVGRLSKNILINGVSDKVIIYNGAAASVEGMQELHTVPGREEYSSLGALVHPKIQGAESACETVCVNTIDALVNQHHLKPGLIKVDVEGFEHEVFSGARKTLAQFKPVILSELSDPLLRKNGSSSAEVVSDIKDLGYVVKDALYPELKPGQRDYCDIICVPTGA